MPDTIAPLKMQNFQPDEYTTSTIRTTKASIIAHQAKRFLAVYMPICNVQVSALVHIEYIYFDRHICDETQSSTSKTITEIVTRTKQQVEQRRNVEKINKKKHFNERKRGWLERQRIAIIGKIAFNRITRFNENMIHIYFPLFSEKSLIWKLSGSCGHVCESASV